MATSDQHLIENLRRKAEVSLAAELSAPLKGYLRKRGVLCLVDFQENPILDYTRYKSSLSTAAFYGGIDFLASIIERIIFPTITVGGEQTPLISSIDLTEYIKLKEINQQSERTTTTSGLNYQLFKGDLSKCTNLEKIAFGVVAGQPALIPPKLQNNLQLRSVVVQGTPLVPYFTTEYFGDLSSNMYLEEYRVRFLNTGNSTIKETADNILNSLRIQKEKGGNISIIELGEMSAPTNGVLNEDYLYLIDQGVTVLFTNIII